jgi:hypothetical protein
VLREAFWRRLDGFLLSLSDFFRALARIFLIIRGDTPELPTAASPWRRRGMAYRFYLNFRPSLA